MSEKLRSVNTKFWDDPFIEELSPSEKLLFLYLLTNPQANLLGIYEITIKRISYDTGLNKETVSNGLERFARVRKAFYCGNFIVLPNWLKNQRFNKNMKTAVAREFNELPIELKNNILGNGSESLGNGSESFEMILERLGKYEIEIEEGKREDETEEEKIEFLVFWDLYSHKVGNKTGAEKKWNKLTFAEQTKIISILPAYLGTIKDKQFQPHPDTWLNQRRWENEDLLKPCINGNHQLDSMGRPRPSNQHCLVKGNWIVL